MKAAQQPRKAMDRKEADSVYDGKDSRGVRGVFGDVGRAAKILSFIGICVKITSLFIV